MALLPSIKARFTSSFLPLGYNTNGKIVGAKNANCAKREEKRSRSENVINYPFTTSLYAACLTDSFAVFLYFTKVDIGNLHAMQTVWCSLVQWEKKDRFYDLVKPVIKTMRTEIEKGEERAGGRGRTP